MKKQLSSDDLKDITAQTLNHYESSARAFWEGTKDHDVTQNYEALLGNLPTGKRLRILDLGCGPGRDLVYFKSLGHDPVGLDGSPTFCEMAKKLSGCETWHQNFLALSLPAGSFDGVFANASLFHVPRQELPRVLGELKASLVQNGILFSSNPRGNGEGWHGDRYGSYMEFEPYREILISAGFEPVQHYYRPAGRPRAEQSWLAVVSRSV